MSYTPPRPPQGILDKFANDTAPNTQCGHVLYSMPEQFADHILWCLHPKCKSRMHTLRLFQLLNGRHKVCTNCIINLLSKVTFKELTNDYSACHRDVVDIKTVTFATSSQRKNKKSLCELVYLYVFCHPKISKLMIKTCALNQRTYLKADKQKRVFRSNLYVHDFDYMCGILVGFSNSQEVSRNAHCAIKQSNFYKQVAIYLGMLYVSIKYWNKYHLLFFLRHYLLKLEHAWVDLFDKFKQHRTNDMLHTVVYFIELIFTEVAFRAIGLHCDEVKDWKVWNAIKRYRQKHKGLSEETRKLRLYEAARGAKVQVSCSWIGCDTKKPNVNKEFKVCKQCKMAYYCSKHCQKRSWKADHRNICKRLSKHCPL